MIQMAACRYLTDFLRADIGGGVMRLNQAMAALPLMPGDSAPPPFRVITDEFRPGDVDSQRCAQNADPRLTPALYLTGYGPVALEGEVSSGGHTGRRRAVFSVALRTIIAASDYAAMHQWSEYAMKGVIRCLYDFADETDVARTARGEGNAAGVYVIALGDGSSATNTSPVRPDIAYMPWKEQVGQSVSNKIMVLRMVGYDLSVQTGAGASPGLATSLALTPSPASVSVGQSVAVIATLLDGLGAPVGGRAVSFASSAPLKATPTPSTATTNGLGQAPVTLVGVGVGSAAITASADGLTTTDTVSVTPAVGTVTVVLTPSSIFAGGTSALVVTVRDTGGALMVGKTVTLSASAPAIASVSPLSGTTNGSGQVTATVTGVAAGTSVMTGTCDGVTGTATQTVATDAASQLVTDLGGDSAVVWIGRYTDLSDGVVDAWADHRGGAFTYTVTATGTTRPVKSASGITFDGVDDELIGPLSALFDYATNGGMTLVLIGAQQSGGTGNRHTMMVDSGSLVKGIGFRLPLAFGSNIAGFEYDGVTVVQTDTGIAASNTIRCAQMWWKSDGTTGVQVGSNAAVAGTTISAPSAHAGNRQLIFGDYGPNAGGGQGQLVAKTALVLPGVLTPSQWTTIKAYAVSTDGATL